MQYNSEELKGYKGLERQEKLLKLPCKEGDKVYEIITNYDNFDGTPHKIAIAMRFELPMLEEIGKTIFLTEEEAWRNYDKKFQEDSKQEGQEETLEELEK